MRTIALVSVVLFGCSHEAGPPGFDDDLPARLDCTTVGTSDGGVGHVTWRGTLDPSAGTFDFTRGPLHLDVQFFGETEQPEVHATGTVTWEGDELSLASDALGFTLSRMQDVAGFVVEGTVDLGAEEPVQTWCWNPEIVSGFAYDEQDGVCRDADGVEGTEPRPIGLVRETGDAQCADLRGIALDEGEYAYQAWDGFDLRGADLDGASLHFADITDGSLQGAKLAGLDYGYAVITGVVDAHTTLPAEGCEAGYGSIECMR